MIGSTTVRVVAGVGGAAALAWAAVWLLWPAPLPQVGGAARPVVAAPGEVAPSPSPSPILRTEPRPRPSEPSPRLPGPTVDAPEPSPEARAWEAARAEVHAVIDAPPLRPLPDASRAAYEAYRRAHRERLALLDAMEHELVDRIEVEADPVLRLDAQVTLAELYEAQAAAFEDTLLRRGLAPAREQAAVERIALRAAIARDKAGLVTQLARDGAPQAGVAPELQARLAHLPAVGGD